MHYLSLFCESSKARQFPMASKSVFRSGAPAVSWTGKMATTAQKTCAPHFGGWFYETGSRFRFGKLHESDTFDSRKAYIDFDRPNLRRLKTQIYFTIARAIGIRLRAIEYRRRRGGRGWHVVLHLAEPMEPAELIALQAICGSDTRREYLNLHRVLAIRKHGAPAFWQKRWNILFSGKVKRYARTTRGRRQGNPQAKHGAPTIARRYP